MDFSVYVGVLQYSLIRYDRYVDACICQLCIYSFDKFV